MYDTIGDLMDALSATTEIIPALLDGVTQEQALAAKEQGGWSVVEVLCHLRDAEEIAIERNLNILQEDVPTIEAYDEEGLAKRRNYAAARLGEALKAFLDSRQRHLEILDKLNLREWHRTGWHTEIGTISIYDHMIHMAAHDSIHASQIARLLSGS